MTRSTDPDVAGLNVVGLHRTLDQELIAVLRGASLECPVCGEFLLHRADGIGCPQCLLELQCLPEPHRRLEVRCGVELGAVGIRTDGSTG